MYLREVVKNLPLQLGPKPAHFGAGFQKIVEKTCPNLTCQFDVVLSSKQKPALTANMPLKTCLYAKPKPA